MSDTHQTDSVPSSEFQNLSEHIEENSDAKRRELGVEDGLNDIPGVTTLMLRGGPGCLNRISASISGASAGVRLPNGEAAA